MDLQDAIIEKAKKKLLIDLWNARESIVLAMEDLVGRQATLESNSLEAKCLLLLIDNSVSEDIDLFPPELLEDRINKITKDIIK